MRVRIRHSARLKVLRDGNLRRFYIGYSASKLGTAMASIALAFAVLDAGGSAVDLGYVFASGIGQVPWWPTGSHEVTLHRVLVHMIAETDRHAGHADIVRELIDETVGFGKDDDNIAPGDPGWWKSYLDRLEQVAQEAARR